MTDSANNNSKNGPSSFSEDLSEDLNATLNKAKPSLVSSSDQEDDEDAIDRLLMAEGLNAEEAQQAGADNGLPDEFDEFGGDFSELMPVQEEEENEESYDPFAGIVVDDEASPSIDDEAPSGLEGFFELDDFDEQEPEASYFESGKPIDPTGQMDQTLKEGYQGDNFLFADSASDEEISDDMDFFNLNIQSDIDEVRTAIQDAKRPEKKSETVLPPISTPDMDETIAGIKPRRAAGEAFVPDSMDSPTPSRFNPDQESISRLQKTLRTEFEGKTKKIRVYAYIAMGLGCAALVSAIGFGLMAYSAKKEALMLTELVNTLQETGGHTTIQNSNKELDDLKSAIEQLNQRVDSIMEQLSNKVPLSTEAVTNESTEGLAATEQDPLKDLQTRLDTLESKMLAVAVQPEAAKADAIKPVAVNQEAGKPATATAKARKVKPQKSTQGKVNSTADWSVNLVAYRQQWHAKSKAAEFERKGIPVDVVDVKVGNITWYRLRVGGFKNREEAALYATKVKKTLNLSSVWVG